MGNWVVDPDAVKSVFEISEDIGIWQEGWDMDIRSGCHRARPTESPSKDGTSLCHICNTKFHTISSGAYGYVLSFGRSSWDGVDRNITDWIDYWIGTPGTVEIRYSGKTWEDALYVEDWETV